MNTILFLLSQDGERRFRSLWEVLDNGGHIIFLLGLLTVFAVILLLYFILEFFHFAVTKVSEKQANQIASFPQIPAPVVSEVQADALLSETECTSDEEIVAVIAAAIACATASAPNAKFKVVSFKKR